jgi:hypothetical protein
LTGITIHRVAIDIEGPRDVPPDFRRIHGINFGRQSQLLDELKLDDIMALLYSKDPYKGRHLGCRGLRDVFWIETNTFDPEFQTFDESVNLRPLEPAEINGQGAEHMDSVMKYAEANKGTGQHHLLKLCLNPASAKVYQRIFLYIDPYIQGFVCEVTTRVSESIGCEVSLSCAGAEIPDSGLRVLKFLGRPQSVEIAMQAFADERARFNEKAKQFSFKLQWGDDNWGG